MSATVDARADAGDASTRTARRACATGSSSRRRWPDGCSASSSSRAIRVVRGKTIARAADAGRGAAARSAHAGRARARRSRPRARRSDRRRPSASARRRHWRARDRRCGASRSWTKAGAIAARQPRGGARRRSRPARKRCAPPSSPSPAPSTSCSSRARGCRRRRRPAAPWTIVAPVDGVVLKRLRESESVVPVGEPLIEIGDPPRLEIVADLLSTDAVRVPPGAPVLVEQWGGERSAQGARPPRRARRAS